MRKFGDDMFIPPLLGSKIETVTGTLNAIMWNEEFSMAILENYAFSQYEKFQESY
jgi:hypothetical protein